MSKRYDVVGALSKSRLPVQRRPLLALIGPDTQVQSNRVAYRFRHGEAEVITLNDGTVFLPPENFVPDAPVAQEQGVEEQLGRTAGLSAANINIPVLRLGDELILIDVGSGSRGLPTAGHLSDNLIAARLDPLSITRVALTHAHPGHISGMTYDDGRLRFPNAIYYVSAVEWEFWCASDFASTMPSTLLPLAECAQRNFRAIRDRVILLRPGSDVVPGLQALGTPGHTPGHLSFVLQGREPLIFTGDALINEFVSIEHPTRSCNRDIDASRAVRTRLRLLEYLAKSGNHLLATHFSYPGLGVIDHSGSSFRFRSLA